MIHTILTHAGTFHADEVIAVAFLRKIYPNADVVRTYEPTEPMFLYDNIIVLDIGRKYEPQLHNYDHHQNENLPASNMLVLRHFYQDAGLSERERDLLETYLFGYVSDVDTGKMVENLGEAPPTINSIIRSLNNVESGFSLALRVASIAIDGAIETARRRVKSETDWLKVKKLGRGFALWDNSEHIVGWHDLAKQDGIQYLITPNVRTAGSYQITSRDSFLYPIPAHHTQTFRHNSGFLAAYGSLSDALDHSKIFC